MNCASAVPREFLGDGLKKGITTLACGFAAVALLLTGCGPAAVTSNAAPMATHTATPSPKSTPSAIPSTAVSPMPVSSARSGKISGTFNVTTSDGYTSTIAYSYTGSIWTADPSVSKPGKTQVTGKPQASGSITNTTPQRQNPTTYIMNIVGLYGLDSPVCKIAMGVLIQKVMMAEGGKTKYCSANLTFLLPPVGSTLAPNQTIPMTSPPEGVVSSELDESIAPQVIDALENPTKVVVAITVPLTATTIDTITVSGSSCRYREANFSDSKDWAIAGSWVVPNSQPAVCSL